MTIEENNSQKKRRTWTQNLQPTHKCALETPADSVQTVTCPWLSLTPSQASALCRACGLRPLLCAGLRCGLVLHLLHFLLYKVQALDRQVLVTLWCPLKLFLRRRDSSPETPFVFSLTFPQASCSTHLCICSHIPHQQTAAYFWLQSTAGSRDGSGRENGIPLPTAMPMRAAGLCSIPWHLPTEICVNFYSMTSAKSFFPYLQSELIITL